MNKNSLAKCVLIIISLLMSQVGKAYATIQTAAHCNMQTMSMPAANQTDEDVDSTGTESPNDFMDENVSSTEQMDCCDTTDAAALISFEENLCCDGQCECSSLVSSIVMLTSSLNIFQSAPSNTLIAFYALHVPSADIKPTNRPPII
ncbi:hypothetical protein [Agaribacter marinus]|nr:hypothetical protein [Agaribacter marinus]